MTRFKTLLPVIGLLVPGLHLAQAASVPARVYIAPLHDARWQASKVEGRCQLEHQIPGIGETKLALGHQESLSFELHITQDINLGNSCQVLIDPPPWRHNVTPQNLGTVKLVPNAKHLMARGGAAQKIFQALESGMQASFSCKSKANPLTTVQVVVSPVRYRVALPEFQKCTADLGKKKPETKTAESKKKMKAKPKPKSKAKAKTETGKST